MVQVLWYCDDDDCNPSVAAVAPGTVVLWYGYCGTVVRVVWYCGDDDVYNPSVALVAPGTGRHPFPLGAAGSGD